MQSTNQYYPTHPGVSRQDSNTLPSHEHSTPRTTSVPANTENYPSVHDNNYNYTSDNRYYTDSGPNPAPVVSNQAVTSTSGPHNSNLANKFDPRVDSDADRGAREGQYGPHSSRLANAADPRVDSDKDRRANPAHTKGIITKPQGAGAALDPTSVQQNQYQNPHHHHHHHPLQQSTSAPHPQETTATNTTTTSTGGGIPVANNDVASAVAATGGGISNSTSGVSNSSPGVTPPTNAMRALGGMGMDQQYRMPGPAPNTAGPHRSDLLNKVDPRVDSNQDGSMTLGRDKAVPLKRGGDL